MDAHLFSFLTLLLLTAVSSNYALDYMCPGVINAPQYYRTVHFEPNLFERRRQGYEKMRFRIFFDESVDKQPPDFKSFTQEAANFWSDALFVRPYDGTMFIKRDCGDSGTVFTYSHQLKKYEKHCSGPCPLRTTCQDKVIPEYHLKECTICSKNGTECHTTRERGKGIENADMVFYVTALQTKTCSVTSIAYAMPCNLDPLTERPIVGGINICPLVAVPLLKKRGFVVAVIKHEMMHALGFHPYFYNLFRDSKGKPLVERDNFGEPSMLWYKQEFGPKIVKTVERKWHVRGGIISSNRTFIVTPNVVREARAHFNCSELEGAELEDFESNRTAGAHWESRVYLDDIMKGGSHGEERISRIDLAFLEDTGWYKVNYSLAEPMEYGKDLGCDFCMKSCKYWMDKKRKESKSVEPFCDQTEDKSLNYLCNKTDKIFTVCPLRRNEAPVPMKYQYFDKLEGVKEADLPFFSGFSMLADYCPILITRGIHCNEQLTPDEALSHILKPQSNIALETFSDDSYCFESRTKWTVNEYKDTCFQVESISKGENAGCYNFLCMRGFLVVKVSNKLFPCFFEGQVLEISLFGPIDNATHEGTIVCPSCVDMCGQSSNFKCKPENPTLASEYPYVKDECTDGDSFEKKISSLNNPRNQSTTVTSMTKTEATGECKDTTCTDCPLSHSFTLVPSQLINNLVTFVIIELLI